MRIIAVYSVVLNLLTTITIIALSLALAGCFGASTSVYDERVPHQDDAVAMVWSALEGVGAPPFVEWKDADPSCHTEYPHETRDMFRTEDGECAFGYAFPPAAFPYVRLARQSTLGRTSLVHEFAHTIAYRKTGDSDPLHTGPFFTRDYLEPIKELLVTTGW